MSNKKRFGPNARPLDDGEVGQAITHTRSCSNSRLSDEVKLLLSLDCGLGYREIASLTFADVCDDKGGIREKIVVHSRYADSKLPLNVRLSERTRIALQRFRAEHPEVPFIAVSNRARPTQQNGDETAAWLRALLRSLGLVGCGSQSGRAAFLAVFKTYLLRKHGPGPISPCPGVHDS